MVLFIHTHVLSLDDNVSSFFLNQFVAVDVIICLVRVKRPILLDKCAYTDAFSTNTVCQGSSDPPEKIF